MRTIKFRGRCAFSGVWRYGFYYVSKENHIIRNENDRESIVLEKSVGQFTGLHDKNGKEIYEGDLVSDGNFIYEVEYNVQNTKFCIDPKKKINSEFTLIDVINYNQLGNGYYSRKDLEIIGNIYENPELLTD